MIGDANWTCSRPVGAPGPLFSKDLITENACHMYMQGSPRPRVRVRSTSCTSWCTTFSSCVSSRYWKGRPNSTASIQGSMCRRWASDLQTLARLAMGHAKGPCVPPLIYEVSSRPLYVTQNLALSQRQTFEWQVCCCCNFQLQACCSSTSQVPH